MKSSRGLISSFTDRLSQTGSARPILIVFCAWLAVHQAPAQFSPSGALQARSRSGQFIVQALPVSQQPLLTFNPDSDPRYTRLDATLVAVSCERIKQILGRHLGLTAPWNGKIFITIYPAGSADDPVTLATDQFRDKWQYHLALPGLVQRVRYVEAIVQVVLLEIANRGAAAHSGEVPLWLTEGFTQELLASNGIEIILPPATMADNSVQMVPTSLSAARRDPLEATHRILSAGQPLTFQQLSWPAPDQIEGEAAQVYRSSAQLFVKGLLELRSGGACLRAMLAELPQHYNWQFAFLHAFQAHFQRPLDVEKWWALQVTHFTGRDLVQTWPADESWQKLDEIICPSVQVRLGTNDLPLRAEISLQSIIREWDRARQTAALQGKLIQLGQLRLRAATNSVPLIDAYRETLQSYLEQAASSRGWGVFHRKKTVPLAKTDEILKRLNQLDAQRAEFKPTEKPSPLTRAGPGL